MPVGPYDHRWMPAVGTVSYNGFRFPAAFEARIKGSAVYDAADVSIKYVRYVLDISTIIASSDAMVGIGISGNDPTVSIDTAIKKIRSRLLEPGKDLIISLQGFGDIKIYTNTAGPKTYNSQSQNQSQNQPSGGSSGQSGGQSDINLGPKPRELLWEPIGSNKACRLVWQVEFCVKECDNDQKNNYGGNAGYTAFTYEASWNVDDEGLTTRTIDGVFEIPVSRMGDFTSDRAERLRALMQLRVPIPTGFKRAAQNYTESADKKALKFVIVDKEIQSEHPYPDFMVKVRLIQTVESEGPAFKEYKVKITGSATVAPGVPKALGLIILTKLVKQRYQAGFQRIAVALKDSSKSQSKTTMMFPYPSYLMIEEDIFNRSFRFSFAWYFVANLKVFLTATGMFKPLETDWEEWANSLISVRTTSPKGYSALGMQSNQEAIISICDPNVSPKILESKTVHDYDPYVQFLFSYEAPPVQSSYMKYELEIQQQTDTPVMVLRNTTTIQDPKKAGAQKPTNDQTHTTIEGIYPTKENSQAPDTTTLNHLQQSGVGSTTIKLLGSAVRILYPPQTPRLESIGGRRCILVDAKVATKVLRASETSPVLAAKWELTYVIEEARLKTSISDYKGNLDTASRGV